MSANQFKNAPEPEEEVKKPMSKRLQKMHDYDFMVTKDNAGRLVPFMLYVGLWVIIYIANHHYGERTLSEMDKVNRETKDFKADFYTINAELSNKSIQSEVAKMAAPLGLKPLTRPPQRLKLIKQDER